jgi:GAF domain-containing protein
MAASSEGARHLELFQLQHSEGPCLDCFRNREPIITTDLSQEIRRWPDFAPRAMEAGIRSVHAFPMRLRDRVIGALNVFGDEALPLGPADVKVVQAMADVATIAILQERAIASADVLTEQLQGALNSRIVIEQAKGVVSRDHGVNVDDAFIALRAHARTHHLRLADLAHDVVNREVELPRP